MNICYLDFWPGFDIQCNWFNLLFKEYFKKELVFTDNPNDADIILASSFGNERKKISNLKATRIFYTGENERPDLDFADYSLSFDYDTHVGRNLRLPHWYLYINWWNEPNFPHAQISLEQLNYKWDAEEVWNRDKFCSIMIGNPVPNRIEIANIINSNVGTVDPYGKVFGNPFDGDKVKLLENYKFNICFENSITEGYVTEKLLQAKVAGCIPIYYGHDSFGDDFNRNCAINYADYNINSIIELMVSLQDKNTFINMVNEPLFINKPNLDFIYNFFDTIFGDNNE